jgi:hypothetical protein
MEPWHMVTKKHNIGNYNYRSFYNLQITWHFTCHIVEIYEIIYMESQNKKILIDNMIDLCNPTMHHCPLQLGGWNNIGLTIHKSSITYVHCNFYLVENAQHIHKITNENMLPFCEFG